jgi:hypothetical protein
MQTLTFRPSDLLLDRVLNPAGDLMLGDCEPEHLIEACGIIPEFFAQACLSADPLTLDEIANQMGVLRYIDEAYSFGGFRYPFGGDITASGVYQSEHETDEDLPPLARFIFDRFECFVYEYGIAAIRDRATRETKIARFD